jgi:large subunit ribosomal protein L23
MARLAQDIILKPVITERAVDLLETGKYTFKVAKDANKFEIKSAVESLFKVEVAKVHTMHVRGRSKRMGRYEGKTSSWKKAIITLKGDKTIEFFDSLH